MSNEADNENTEIRTVVLVNISECEIADEEIAELLDETELPCAPTAVSVEEVEDLQLDEDCVVLIPIDSASVESAELVAACRSAGASGAHVVGVCKPDVGQQDVSFIRHYGTSVSWSSQELNSCLAQGRTSRGTTPSGEPNPKMGTGTASC